MRLVYGNNWRLCYSPDSGLGLQMSADEIAAMKKPIEARYEHEGKPLYASARYSPACLLSGRSIDSPLRLDCGMTALLTRLIPDACWP